jgi:Tol biopolymer transport system component
MLGPYEILALIGVGGMGEVYRARDTRLDRDVAIKISAEKFTERFAREARSIASLNHTNACHLYDVSPDYLVMEYVEGHTLAGPLDDALPIIRQLIDGIEAAHEKNIVHRDLKPANIKITPDGVVKVLDFGLAKACAPEPEGNPEASPTLTMQATVAGAILGTAGYMAPEQARGKTADKRADIWAFGVVVYELLTGKRPFQGETAIEILGAVINKEPDWSIVPQPAQRLLKWCLEKDRKQRLQDIGDARRLLDEPAEPPPAIGLGRWVAWAAAAAVMLAASAGWFAANYLRKPQQRGVVTFTIDPPAEKYIGEASVSPDGRQVALLTGTGLADSQIQIRTLDNLSLRPLPGTEQTRLGSIVWSPDSRRLAFVQGNQIKSVDLLTGAVRTLSTAENISPSDWGENGMILVEAAASGGQKQVFQVPASGGPAKPAIPLDAGRKESSQTDPYFLPGGKQIIYSSKAQTESGLYVASVDKGLGSALAGSQRRFVPSSGSGEFQGLLRDPETGESYLVFCDVECAIQQFDTSALRLTGDPYPIPQASRVRGTSVAAAGLAFVPADPSRIRLAWYSRDGKELEVVSAPDSLYSHELSPDNKQLGLELLTPPRGRGDIWTQDLVRGSRQRITSDPGWEFTQRFWPDGSKIAYMWFRENPRRWNLATKPTNGAGKEDLVLESPEMIFLDDISPDGAFLLYYSYSSPHALWLLPLADRHAVLFHTSSGDSNFGRFSPDGRWIAYASTDSGASEIQVLDFDSTAAHHTKGELTVVSIGGGRYPRWSADGKELFYLTPDNTLMSVPVKTSGGFTAGKPAKLFRLPVRRGANYRNPYAVSADSRRFLVAVPEAGEAPNRLVVITNWMESLIKR